MRYSFFLIIFSIFINSCAVSPNTTPPIVSQTKAANPTPTKFTVGKCIDTRPPTPDPNEISLFPRPTNEENIIGNVNAKVTVLVYSDYQCISCSQLNSLLNSIVEKNHDDVRVIFRDFPLISVHDKAAMAAQAVNAAGRQGKFLEMHDLLFSKQPEWIKLSPNDFEKWLASEVALIGLDKNKFINDVFDPTTVEKIQKAWVDGQKINLPGVPVILINGEIIKWQVNLLDQLEGYVNLAILSTRQFSNCPPVVIDLSKSYYARIKSTRGDFVIRLFADKSPNTVNNFVFLARKGWYNDIPIYRVVTGKIVQTGDPSGTGFGGPGYFISSEKNNLVYDRAGMVGMLNSGPDTNGSQFFISLSPAAQFDQNYPIFGEIIEGMDVLNQLPSREPSDPITPNHPDKIITISIDEK